MLQSELNTSRFMKTINLAKPNTSVSRYVRPGITSDVPTMQYVFASYTNRWMLNTQQCIPWHLHAVGHNDCH